MAKGRCKFVIISSAAQAMGQRSAPKFPVSKAGWKNALKEAARLKEQGEPNVDINFQCGSDPSESIFLVTCRKEGVCDTSVSSRYWRLSEEDHVPIAGMGQVGNKKRKKARGKKKRTGPLTPQQQKFKRAAAACKGSADYRSCVTDKLRK